MGRYLINILCFIELGASLLECSGATENPRHIRPGGKAEKFALNAFINVSRTSLIFCKYLMNIVVI